MPCRQAYPDRHFPPPVDFLFQESLVYTSILLRRNVSAWISLRGLRRLIRVDTLRRCHNVGFSRGTTHMFNVMIPWAVSLMSRRALKMSYCKTLCVCSIGFEPSPGSSVGSDAGCQSRGCEFESRLGQLSFRRLAKSQCDMRHSSSTNGLSLCGKAASCLGKLLCGILV